VTQERTRIARELHDSLGQDLAGIGMQLETAAARLADSPERAGSALDTARMMVQHSQAEARRSVADLRAPELENVDLPTALEKVLRPLVPGEAALQLRIQVEGTPRPLLGLAEHHLLRIAQESVANAIRHADAKEILVRLRYDEKELSLEVKDDGRGFDATKATAIVSGHFGLLGLRERANKLQGRLRIESQPADGTLIAVAVSFKNHLEP